MTDTKKPSTKRWRGTDPKTGKSFDLLSDADRTAIARVKTIAERWTWGNREHTDTEAPEIGANVVGALADWLGFDHKPPGNEPSSPIDDGTNPIA